MIRKTLLFTLWRGNDLESTGVTRVMSYDFIDLDLNPCFSVIIFLLLYLFTLLYVQVILISTSVHSLPIKYKSKTRKIGLPIMNETNDNRQLFLLSMSCRGR